MQYIQKVYAYSALTFLALPVGVTQLVILICIYSDAIKFGENIRTAGNIHLLWIGTILGLIVGIVSFIQLLRFRNVPKRRIQP